MLFSTSLDAANITIEYTGVLDRVETGLSYHFSPGDRFTGAVTYSTTEYNGMMVGNPYADLDRLRGFHDVITEFIMDIGDFNFSVSNVGIVQIYNDSTQYVPPYSVDWMGFTLGNTVTPEQYAISPAVWNFIDETAGPLPGGLHMDNVYIDLLDWTSSLFTDRSLPLTFPGFDAFTEKTMFGSFYESGGGFGLGGYVGTIYGTLTSMEAVSQVPVPATVWLFGSGFIGLIGLARRKEV